MSKILSLFVFFLTSLDEDFPHHGDMSQQRLATHTHREEESRKYQQNVSVNSHYSKVYDTNVSKIVNSVDGVCLSSTEEP